MRNPIAARRVRQAMHPFRLAPALLALLLLLAGCSLLPFPGPTPIPPNAPNDPAQPRVPIPAPPDPQTNALANAQAGELRAALAAWEASGIDSYTWRLAVLCECSPSGLLEITVVDGVPTKVDTPTGQRDLADLAGFPLTVDAVLQEAIDAIGGGGQVRVQWGPRAGVPTSMTIDRMPRAIDDELNLEVTGLDPAP